MVHNCVEYALMAAYGGNSTSSEVPKFGGHIERGPE
jgi:6-phosphogluconate dehydrogenase (decarboxylating)